MRFLEQKNKEAALPEAEQHEVHIRREKHAPKTFLGAEARDLQMKTQDQLIFSVWQSLNRNDSTGTFLTLYKQAHDGKLVNHEIFVQLCSVLSDQVRRTTSDNPRLKNGIRYPRDYLNFMTVMRSYGGQTASQYTILRTQLGGPCPRTLR